MSLYENGVPDDLRTKHTSISLHENDTPEDQQIHYETMSLYEDCTLCPHACHVNRMAGEKGRCGMGGRPVAARAALHFWEEPCISGQAGSGTVFFTGCNLRCIYCQNREISRGMAGREITEQELAEIFRNLQEQGACNVNLVTGVHFVPSITKALRLARENGLSIPVVYNSGGYETVSTLRVLEGLVDVYLPDYKYADSELAAKLSGAENYPDTALEAIREMVRQTGPCVLDDHGMLIRGTLVRHLILPGHTQNSCRAVELLLKNFGEDVMISLMNQYTPVQSFPRFPELNRRVTKREYEKVLAHAMRKGLENGFFQEGPTAEESFIPPFDLTGIP